MKNIFLVSLLIFTTSCASVEFIRKETVPQKQGVLKHSIPSNLAQENKYRDKVFAKAQAFCGGDFNITREYQALDESRSTAGLGTGFGVGSRSSVFFNTAAPVKSMFSFVEFTCK